MGAFHVRSSNWIPRVVLWVRSPAPPISLTTSVRTRASTATMPKSGLTKVAVAVVTALRSLPSQHAFAPAWIWVSLVDGRWPSLSSVTAAGQTVRTETVAARLDCRGGVRPASKPQAVDVQNDAS